jgi:hypothetical protein
MKKQIAKSISILSLLVLLSGGAINVYASGGTCSVPSCRPRVNIAAPSTTPDVAKLSEQELYEQELVFSEQPEDIFGFGYFLAQWVLNFLRSL